MAVDTLRIYERLKNHELPEAAARELAEVFRENIEEGQAELATKKNVDDAINLAVETLRKEMAEMKYGIVKWLVALLLAQTAALIAAKVLIR